MRIAKNILTLISIACLTLSCKKEPEITVTERRPIEFKTEINSKSYIDQLSTLQQKCTKGNGKGILLYGKKTDEYKNTLLFIEGRQLQYDNGNWVYGSPVYWGLNSTHHFLGVYHEKGTHTYNNTTDTYKIETINATIKDNDDILYARNTTVYDAIQAAPKVNLIMQHALSAISVNIKNLSGTAITSITGITLQGLYTNASQIEIPLIGSPEKEPVSVTLGTNQEVYQFSEKSGINLPGNSEETYTLLGPLIILPQDFLKNNITLNFTINDETSPRKVQISAMKVETDREHAYEYRSGRHYKYTITITDNSINMSMQIVPWIEDEIILK